MYRANHSQNTRFELPGTQSGTKKEPIKKALNLNGGLNAHWFELFFRYYKHVNSSNSNKIS